MTSPDGLSRGVPVQDLPENQDPSVRHTVDEVTGIVTQWDDEPEPKEKPAKKRAAKKAAPSTGTEDGGDHVPADDAGSGDAGAEAASEKAVDTTSLRELGS
jgi:hypothetical protein